MILEPKEPCVRRKCEDDFPHVCVGVFACVVRECVHEHTSICSHVRMNEDVCCVLCFVFCVCVLCVCVCMCVCYVCVCVCVCGVRHPHMHQNSGGEVVAEEEVIEEEVVVEEVIDEEVEVGRGGCDRGGDR